MSSMLRDTLYRLPRDEGLQLLQRRGTGGAKELTTWRLRLRAGTDQSYSAPGEETVLVMQSGTGSVAVAGQSFAVSRKDVFEERATAVYVPPGASATISATSDLEAILASTPATGGGPPALMTPGDVRVNARGRGNYAREVHDIFVNDSVARRIMIGETFNAPGHWSSYPPHKHDGRDGELRLEEMYYYRVDPPDGFGLHVQYTADGEAVTHQVRDGDLVLIPYGYHSVAAPPGYRVYYLWAIAGDERRLAVFEDPSCRWLHGAT
jgi:5-deoxy-glucuronate isomerase